jgi:hypothetical protein
MDRKILEIKETNPLGLGEEVEITIGDAFMALVIFPILGLFLMMFAHGLRHLGS